MASTQKIRTWNKFSNTERWLVSQAFVLLPFVNLHLKLLGFKRTYALLRFWLPKTAPCCPSLIHKTVQSASIAAKYHPWATCLRKSLVLWFLLRRQQIAVEFKIGTRFEREEFQAHAWVEHQGTVVGDRQGIQQCFRVFSNFKLQ